MSSPIKTEDLAWLVLYDASLPQLFQELAQPLRKALGSVALRIDHIGSTSIPQLAARPIIDIQVSVAAFEPGSTYHIPLEDLGYCLHAQRPGKSELYIRETTMQRQAYVHVRKVGSFHEQFTLLHRDYLRAHADVAARYANLHLDLAQRYYQNDNCQDYTEAIKPFIWQVFAQAGKWAQQTGWLAGTSDA